jgi:hypothetical protein
LIGKNLSRADPCTPQVFDHLDYYEPVNVIFANTKPDLPLN